MATNTQPAHTPGPWKADGCIVRTGGNVADYVADCTPLGLIIREQGEANAQLIACAPELLDALREALTALEASKVLIQHRASMFEREQASKARTMARAIIAKASGVQS